MLNQLFTTKDRTTQEFRGIKRVPATILALPKQVVTALKSADSDGYSAIQVAIGQKNLKPNKPQLKALKAAKIEYKPRWTKEIRVEQTDLSVGSTLPINEIIGEGDTVKITGVSKGHGFAGVMKRHGFHGGPKTHGQSDRARAPGSIGRGTTPGRVVKGKKMAGRMGNDTVTVKGLKVLKVDLENQLIILSGLVPGSKDGLIRLTITKKNPNPVQQEVVEEVAVAQVEQTDQATETAEATEITQTTQE